jgi:hypothetical protein
MSLDRARLGPLDKLGEGGSGDVYELPGSGTVYKEFNQLALTHTDIRLWSEGSVAFWDSLTPSEQAELAALAVWPTATVEVRGRTVGVVMPLLPDRVFHLRTGRDGSVERQLNEIKWLLVERDKLVGRFDVDLLDDEATRYELLAQVLAFLAWLHARGVCFGDVSHANFVFSLNPPRVLALDTDAVVTSAATAAPLGRHTPYYEPPEMQHGGTHDRIDQQVDVWKAATLALRALTPGRGAFQRRPDDLAMLLGRAPDRIVDLLSLALGADRDRRPTMAELAAAFLDHVASLSSPPTAVRLEIVAPVVRRGSAIEVRWELEGAEQVAVDLPGGARLDLDPVLDARGFTFTATTSGTVAVHATNRHGTTTLTAGRVQVYDVPMVPVRFSGPRPPGLDDLARPLRPVLAGLARPPAPPRADVRVSLGAVPGLPQGPDAALPDLTALGGGAQRRLAALARSRDEMSVRLAALLGGQAGGAGRRP